MSSYISLGAAILGLLVIPWLFLPCHQRAIVTYCAASARLSSLAVVTTLSVVALPFVQRAVESALDRAGCGDSEERRSVVQTSLFFELPLRPAWQLLRLSPDPLRQLYFGFASEAGRESRASTHNSAVVLRLSERDL